MEISKKMKTLLILILSCPIFAQNIKCKTAEINRNQFNNLKIKAKKKWNEEIDADVIKNKDLEKEFIIPVVFHVFDEG
ncbi:hypothetical protein [Flavobacterium davisii]